MAFTNDVVHNFSNIKDESHWLISSSQIPHDRDCVTFLGTAVYISLGLLVTLSTVESVEQFKINETIYIENGTESVELSCGEVPQSAMAIEWFIHKSNEWRKLLKFYHINSSDSSNPRYFNDPSKYDISKSVNTFLVVKNINLSDTVLFMCGSLGGHFNHSYTTMLQVVGKLLLTYLFSSFTEYNLKCVACLNF